MCEVAVHLAVAGGVFDSVLDEILDLIESVSEGFPTYSCFCNLSGKDLHLTICYYCLVTFVDTLCHYFPTGVVFVCINYVFALFFLSKP